MIEEIKKQNSKVTVSISITDEEGDANIYAITYDLDFQLYEKDILKKEDLKPVTDFIKLKAFNSTNCLIGFANGPKEERKANLVRHYTVEN